MRKMARKSMRGLLALLCALSLLPVFPAFAADAQISIASAVIGDYTLADTADAAPVIPVNVAAAAQITVSGTTSMPGEYISFLGKSEDNTIEIVALGQKTSDAASGSFSFSARPKADIAADKTYVIYVSSTNSAAPVQRYFKTSAEEIEPQITITPNPILNLNFFRTNGAAPNMSATPFVYASTKVGDTVPGKSPQTEIKDGFYEIVGKDKNWPTVDDPAVGVPFATDRSHHRFHIVGSALMGLNHILESTNNCREWYLNYFSGVDENATMPYYADESMQNPEMLTKAQFKERYVDFLAGDKEYYSFVPNLPGTVYYASVFENPNLKEEDGWKLIYMVNENLPSDDQGKHKEWITVSATYKDAQYPYQINKMELNGASRSGSKQFSYVYYRAFDASERVSIPTLGAVSMAADYSSELGKVMIRWGDHISTEASLSSIKVNGENIADFSADKTDYTVTRSSNEAVTLSAETTDSTASVSIEPQTVTSFPATATITVTAAAGNTKQYKVNLVLDESAGSELSVSVTSGTVLVNGQDWGNKKSGNFFAGTELTLQAVPEDDSCKFLYWINDSTHRVVSTNATYSFVMGSDASLSAVFTDPDTGYYITFKNRNNAVLTEGYASGGITVPQNPFSMGYEFIGWIADGVEQELTAGEALDTASITKDMNYLANFRKSEQTYTVNLINASVPSGDYQYNDKIIVTPAAPEADKKFSHWEKDGKTVSYAQTYAFFVGAQDTTVEAKYVAADAEVTVMPLITMSAPQVVNGDSISYLSERFLPDDYTMIETGILLSDTDENMTFDTAGVKISTSNSKANNGQYTVRKVNVSAGDTWYARAYMIYSNGSGGVEMILSDPVTGTL